MPRRRSGVGACSVCGAEARTRCEWKRFGIPWHWRCETHVVEWLTITHFIDLWFGHSVPRGSRAA